MKEFWKLVLDQVMKFSGLLFINQPVCQYWICYQYWVRLLLDAYRTFGVHLVYQYGYSCVLITE